MSSKNQRKSHNKPSTTTRILSANWRMSPPEQLTSSRQRPGSALKLFLYVLLNLNNFPGSHFPPCSHPNKIYSVRQIGCIPGNLIFSFLAICSDHFFYLLTEVVEYHNFNICCLMKFVFNGSGGGERIGIVLNFQS